MDSLEGRSPNNGWLPRSIRFVIFLLVRLFYPRIEVRGADNLPVDGPIIFVLNHPNGLIDPIMLMLGLDHQVSFWAKSTLFGNPFGRTFMEAFGALPIFRQRDEGRRGGAKPGQSPAMNEQTFARCRELLRGGGTMALFPEGTTHSGSRLLKMRTGAARVALGAEQESNWDLRLQMVPVGLWYQSKTRFRTSVLLVVSPPFELTDYAADFSRSERKTTIKATQRIETGLNRVVLQAENAELLAAMPVIAAWTAPEGEALDLAQQHEWTARLLAAYEQLQHSDPDRLEQIADQARSYADALQTLGVNDPWTLEPSPMDRKRPIRLTFGLIVTFPLAAVGFILSYIPYRLAGPVANLAVGSNDTQTSTVKLVGGAVFILLTWIVVAVICGQLFGGVWGLLLFLTAPIFSYAALRWAEAWVEMRELASYQWLRATHADLTRSLVEQRRALAEQVTDAVESLSASGQPVE